MLIHIWESVLSEYLLPGICGARELARLFMDIGIFIGFCTYSKDQEGGGGEGRLGMGGVSANDTCRS